MKAACQEYIEGVLLLIHEQAIKQSIRYRRSPKYIEDLKAAEKALRMAVRYRVKGDRRYRLALEIAFSKLESWGE